MSLPEALDHADQDGAACQEHDEQERRISVAAIQEIADREEIKELTAKYAHWVALGEGAKVAQLFTDDGAFINEVIGAPPNITVRGRQQLDQFYPGIKRGTALPCIHNHIIEIDGDTAQVPAPSKCGSPATTKASTAQATTRTAIGG